MPAEVDEVLRRHLLAAVAAHCRRLRRDGLTPPAGLLAFAISVSNGQARPTLDGSGSHVDSARMGPLAVDYRAAADVLSVSERSVRRAVAAGQLPAVEVAGCRRIRVADLAAFVEALPALHASADTEPAR